MKHVAPVNYSSLRNFFTILDSNIWLTHLGKHVKRPETFKSFSILKHIL